MNKLEAELTILIGEVIVIICTAVYAHTNGASLMFGSAAGGVMIALGALALLDEAGRV